VSFDKIGHGEIKKASALSIAATVDKRPQKSLSKPPSSLPFV
jgi:hypothetical protein